MLYLTDIRFRSSEGSGGDKPKPSKPKEEED